MPYPRLALAAAMAAAIAAIATTFAACGGSEHITTVTSGTVIRNVTVVDTADGRLRERMAVVVDQGRIQTIAAAETLRTAGSAQDLDASGRYLVPGYLDMHTHLLNAPEADLPRVAQLMLAHGITGIREMGGSAALIQRARQHNADQAAGRIEAPEILQIPGAIISGGAPPAASMNAAAATQEVQAQKAYGAGFIKTVGATREATLALVAEASRQGLRLAGHLNPSLSAIESAQAGWGVVEHLGGGSTGLLLDCAADEAALRAAVLSGNPTGTGAATPPLLPSWPATAAWAPVYQRVYDGYDEAKCSAVAQAFAQAGTWHVPTLIRNRTMRFVDDAAYRSDTHLAWVSASTRLTWEAAAQRQVAALPVDTLALYHRYFSREQALAGLLQRQGVKLLAGTDTSIHPTLTAPWVVPGAALHQEFALLAGAGLTPLQVLQATTRNGAQFLGREADLGRVAEGRIADLVLLSANPLADVANLARIDGLFVKGRYRSAADLARLKTEVATVYAGQVLTPEQRATALGAPGHVD